MLGIFHFAQLKVLCDVLEALQLFAGHEIIVHITLNLGYMIYCAIYWM